MLSETFSQWRFCNLAGILRTAFKALKSFKNQISQQRPGVSRKRKKSAEGISAEEISAEEIGAEEIEKY